jgi:hypothetical protein
MRKDAGYPRGFKDVTFLFKKALRFGRTNEKNQLSPNR